MNKLITTMAQYFETVPEQLRQRKLLVWLFFIAMTVFLTFGLVRAEFDMTIEGMFEDEDPAIVALDGFHAEFGSEDNLFIVYKPKDGNVFSTRSLEVVKGIREDLLNRPYKTPDGQPTARQHIVKVTTVVNAPLLTAQQDTLLSRNLVGENVPTDEAGLAEIRRLAGTQKKFPLLYFSPDHKYGGIFVETDFGSVPLLPDGQTIAEETLDDELELDDALEMDNADMAFDETLAPQRVRFKPTDLGDYLALMNEVKLTLNKPEYADHLDYYPVGNTAVTEYDLQVVEEMGMLNLAMLVIIAVMLWFLFRSFSAVIWPIVIVILSTIWTIGIIGWLGLPISSLIMITVMLTLAVGIADAVHILSGYQFFINKGDDHVSAMRQVFRKSAKACLLTTVTTMMAMLVLSMMPMVPVKIFGLMCAIAVGVAFIFTIYLLPVMLDLWAPKATMKKTATQSGGGFSKVLANMLENVLPLVHKNPKGIFAGFLVFFGVCIYGATLTKVDTNPIGAYPKDSSIRETFNVVDTHMMGTQNLEIFLDLGEENAFHDPFVLKTMEGLQQTLETKYSDLVVRTSSIVDVVKQAYQTLNTGREEMYVIPDKRNVVSQTLWMFNNAIPDERSKLVSDNYNRSHISVQLHNAGSLEYTRVFASMRVDIDAAVTQLRQHYPDVKVSVTGMLVLMMQSADYLTKAQLQSFAWALVLISVVLLLVFGSMKAGLIAVIPNLIPATMAFGFLGLFDISLDFTSMMIAPIIIGIAVDDTIHFMTRYQSEVAIDSDIKRALQTTITETGQAIVFTALVLGLGFGVMAFSDSAGTANLGRFGSLAVLAGLLNDLFLLPAMILIFKLKPQQKAQETAQAQQQAQAQ